MLPRQTAAVTDPRTSACVIFSPCYSNRDAGEREKPCRIVTTILRIPFQSPPQQLPLTPKATALLHRRVRLVPMTRPLATAKRRCGATRRPRSGTSLRAGQATMTVAGVKGQRAQLLGPRAPIISIHITRITRLDTREVSRKAHEATKVDLAVRRRASRSNARMTTLPHKPRVTKSAATGHITIADAITRSAGSGSGSPRRRSG